MTIVMTGGDPIPDYESVSLECPFCGEVDFDYIGLKAHLLKGWCDMFESVPPIIAELRIPDNGEASRG